MSEEQRDPAEWIRSVLHEHEGALLRYAWRLTGDAELARDVVQETFLRLCRAEPAVVDGHVGPWLFRVCRQRALDEHRKEQRMPTSASPTIDARPTEEPGPAEFAEHEEDSQDLLRLLAELPPNQQEVVRLKFQAGLRYRQISEVMGLSVSNVGVLLHTAIVRMRERLANRSTAFERNGSNHAAKPKASPLNSSTSSASAEGRTETKWAERNRS